MIIKILGDSQMYTGFRKLSTRPAAKRNAQYICKDQGEWSPSGNRQKAAELEKRHRQPGTGAGSRRTKRSPAPTNSMMEPEKAYSAFIVLTSKMFVALLATLDTALAATLLLVRGVLFFSSSFFSFSNRVNIAFWGYRCICRIFVVKGLVLHSWSDGFPHLCV